MHKRLFDNLSTAVLLFDAALNLRYLNTAAEILLEDSARQLLGISAVQLFKLSDAAFLSNLQHCRDASKSLIGYALELHCAKQSVFVNACITPLESEKKEIEVLVELFPFDTGLRISQEEQLVTQQNAARLIVRGLAHEIKNPLGGIRGAAQLLDLELSDVELKEYTAVIISEADRLQDLVNRMLGSNERPNKQMLNIHEILERVRWLVQTEVGENIKFHCDYDPSIPEFLGDKNQLIQAVLNIVRNASQAIVDEGNIILKTRICRHVTIDKQHHKLAVRCEILDDGIGIDAEMLNKIFYPMITGRVDGTGLGLSISQTLISQHQGMIECSSEKGRTVFTITLPL